MARVGILGAGQLGQMLGEDVIHVHKTGHDGHRQQHKPGVHQVKQGVFHGL